ncbi:MAG TPA: aspartyl protease family protein [candidate division Zixibacteria bacterium]|nr:aspartyl protease family protein [candidate division Zixibacteria bacterium]
MGSLVLTAAAVVVAAAAGAVDVDSLLVQSVGGPEAYRTLAAMTSYRTEGKADINGLEGTYTQIYAAPDRFYMEIRIGGMTLVSAFDGRTAWQRDHNGRVSEVEGMEKRQLIEQVYLASYSFIISGRLPGRSEFLGDTTIADTSWLRVALYPRPDDTVVMLLDGQSALPAYVVQRLDNLTGVTRLSDYRTVAGVALAHSARTEFPEAALYTEMTTESVAFNVEVDPALFDLPGAEPVDYRFAAGADSVVIPFTYYRGHVWLPAAVNGATVAWFILDSGASANLLNDALTAPLGLTSVGSVPAKGVGGFEEVPLVRTDSITIGSLTLVDQIAAAMDWDRLGIEPPPGAQAGGILGHDFLSRFPVLIDYSDSTLTAYNPAAFTAPAGGTAVDFHLTMLVPTISASVGGVEGDFIIDLGNSVGLVLHDRFFQDHRLDTVLTNLASVDRPIGGVGGTARTRSAVVPAFRIGGMVLSDVPVVIPESTQGLAGSTELAGNIGNLVLQEFRVLLDYRASRVYFYPPGAREGVAR